MENYTYKHVFLLGVDGAGSFFKDTDTPHMDRMLKNGATSYDVMTAIPTISAECWGSMLIGSSALAHGLTNSVVGAKHYDEDSPIPSVFKRVRQAMPDAVLASFSNWNPINHGIIEQSLGVTFGTGSDEDVCDQILEYLDDNTPTLLFAQFDSVDGAGHGNGYGTPAHLNQITVVDAHLGKIYDKIVEKDILDDTLLMVIADHGGTPFGSHGGTSEAEKIVFFGAAGKTVKPGTIGEMNVRDSSAIILHALGLPIPEFAFGGFSAQIPENLFEGYIPAERQDIYTLPLSKSKGATPAKDSGKYLTDYIPSEKIAAYLPFDSSADDALGKISTTVHNTVKYYGIGYFSDCIEVGRQGHLTVPDFAPANGSFSASAWVYIDGAVWGALPLLGNKNWSGDSTSGFTMVYDGNGFSFNIGNGSDEVKYHIDHVKPVEFGWNNITAVVDRVAETVTLYYNFKNAETFELPDGFKGISFDSGTFTIGQDATGAINNRIDYKIDDIVLFNDALSIDEMAKLGEYYEA